MTTTDVLGAAEYTGRGALGSPVLGLDGEEVAQLINAPEKNAMRTDSPYAQAVRTAAQKVRRHVAGRPNVRRPLSPTLPQANSL